MTTTLLGDFGRKLDLNVDPTSIGSTVKEAMPKKNSSLKLFMLYGTDCNLEKFFVAMPAVSTYTSETMTRELGYRQCCSEILRENNVITCDLPKITGETSVVSVGSHLYCIGGELESNLPCNKVFKLDRNNVAGRLEECDKMLQKRRYPAVVAVGGKIYVFGGLAPVEEDSSPWAEFLDTNKPKEEQEWKALQDPIFPHSYSKLGCTQLFAFPYDDQTILIGCGVLPNEDAVLYNVTDKSWSRYECFPKICTQAFARPVTVARDKTIYWMENWCLMAYELDKRVHYRGYLTDAVFAYEDFLSAANVPRLVHLEDNLFGFFTLFRIDQQIKVVKCTKVRVTKVYYGNTGHPGHLKFSVLGYQFYRCGPIHIMSGVVSM